MTWPMRSAAKVSDRPYKHYHYYHFYDDVHHGQMSQAPFLSVVKLGLIHFITRYGILTVQYLNEQFPEELIKYSFIYLIDNLIKKTIN